MSEFFNSIHINNIPDMAQAPETYQRNIKDSEDVEGIETLDAPKNNNRSSGPNQYSHRRYRNWRARIKNKQRAKDEERIHQIYSDIGQTPQDYQDYMLWLANDNPLCVQCLEDDNIMPGRVLDHKTPIKQGGNKYDEDNLQWLCDFHHNVKRATDDKQPK